MKSTDDVLRQIKEMEPWRPRGRALHVCGIAVAVGFAAFLYGISREDTTRAWQVFLVNYLFWTGLAFGGVLFSAVLVMTNARWGRPVKRLAEGLGAFLPVSFVLFWALYLGRDEVFPWIHEPVHHKEAWLNVPFFFSRDGAGIFILMVLALCLMYHSIRRDQKALSVETRGEPAVPDTHERAQGVLSPLYALLYALVLTLLAVDLIMSLDPHWVSTLFGAYFFMGSFYTALAAVIILSALGSMKFGLGPYIGAGQFHDLGNLLLGFCILTGDFFYAQFVVIWYGNLPEETRFIIQRVRQVPWDTLSWTVLLLGFVVPFVVLLMRKVKMNPGFMMVLSGLILVGMWLERFLLVAPSLTKGHGMPLGLMEILISAGFLGIMGLCLMVFFRSFPALPVADPLFRESLKTAHGSGH